MSSSREPNWFDMLIYRLFYWRWRRILHENKNMLDMFRNWLDYYDKKEKDHGRSDTDT